MDERILSELKVACKEEQTEAQNEKVFETWAQIAKGMCSAYIAAGFTENQALYLTATVLVNLVRKN